MQGCRAILKMQRAPDQCPASDPRSIAMCRDGVGELLCLVCPATTREAREVSDPASRIHCS